MKHARLDIARSAELLPVLNGPVGVFGQIGLERLQSLMDWDLRCVSSSFAVNKTLSSAGLKVGQMLEAEIDHAIVFVPRAKAEAHDLIAAAVQACPNGWIVIDGQKTDGIESIAKQIARDVADVGSYSKGHGKTIWFRSADARHLVEWCAQASENKSGFVTAPGVFSADDVDPASEMLVEHIPSSLSGQIADLGAGWGFLSHGLFEKCAGITKLHLIEDNAVALKCARDNIIDDRAQFCWADALNWMPSKPLDCVVMNPPFHTTRSAEPTLGIGFIQAAARVLKPGGRLFMVANSHLPYEPTLAKSFEKYELLARSSRFKVYCATRGRGKLI
jgi:16S rRNA (guanine1207-N2)-methyltransferase